VAEFLLTIQKKYGIILIIGGGPGNGAAENRTRGASRPKLFKIPLCLGVFVTKNSVKQCESVKSVAENISIKTTKLCKTKPIFE
jgi:hypothetical protein